MASTSSLRRFSKTHPRVPATAALAVLLTTLGVWLRSPESRLGAWLVGASYNWSQSMLAESDISKAPVVIVYLDLDSYLREKQNPAETWSRALHALLLRRLTAAGAKAVVFDVIFGEMGGDAVADRQFIEAIRANGHVVLSAEIGRSSRDTPQVEGIKSLQLSLPAKPFLDAAAAWGVANLSVDPDSSSPIRTGLLSESHMPAGLLCV